ncbi:ATP-binding cassette domain-containing protein [Candidatus Poribacteria bacterium]|nr:ATP-binding cassette domain-containing protein [Candidatus Poribacteria bacterium]
MHIQVEDLHKSFGDRQVLKGVSLDIPAGQLCVIVGGSGTGKSVLLKHFVGLLKPDRGRVLIDGTDIVPMPERRIMELRPRFGMIFQGGGLLQSISVGENVGLALQELGRESPRRIREIVSEQLRVVGLEGREDQMPATLSGGQRKRAAIARALTTKAGCFLFDEPTAGLDPPMSDNIDQVILQVNRETRATTVVVTHDLVTVFKVADVVHMLHEGEIIASAPPAEFRASRDERVQRFLERELKPATA